MNDVIIALIIAVPIAYIAGSLTLYFIGIELRLLRPRQGDGTLKIDETNPEDVKLKLEFDISMDEIVEQKSLYITVERKK